MQTLAINKRKFYYANPTGYEVIEDEYGNETGERKITYEEPKELKANVSASVGEESVMAFGSFTNYSKTIALANNPLIEGANIWLGIDTDMPANYTVTKIAGGLNHSLVGIKENANN